LAGWACVGGAIRRGGAPSRACVRVCACVRAFPYRRRLVSPAPATASAAAVRSSADTAAPYRTPPAEHSRPLGARASTPSVSRSCACGRACACSRPYSQRTSLIIVRRAADKSLPRKRSRRRRRRRCCPPPHSSLSRITDPCRTRTRCYLVTPTIHNIIIAYLNIIILLYIIFLVGNNNSITLSHGE